MVSSSFLTSFPALLVLSQGCHGLFNTIDPALYNNDTDTIGADKDNQGYILGWVHALNVPVKRAWAGIEPKLATIED